jgi:acyl carrier protein
MGRPTGENYWKNTMKEAEIKKELVNLLQSRMMKMGVKERELKNNFDLVGSGFVNSMEFVELVTDLETRCNVRIDFDSVLESRKFTTVGGLIELFKEYLEK